MTVGTNVSSISYVGDGSNVDFDTDFPFDDQNYLTVSVAGVVKTLGVDYAVSGGGKGQPAGGTVGFVTPPANLAAVVITRNTPIVQTTSLRTQGSFSPATHENEFDTVVEIEQELDRRVKVIESGGNIGTATAGAGLQTAGAVWSVKAGNGISVSGAGVAVSYGAAPLNVNASGALTGVATAAARSDHKHSADVGVPGTAASGDTAAQGVATTLALSDHKHAFPAPTTINPVATDAIAGSLGGSTKFARDDHQHVLGTIQPIDITDSTNSQGTSTSGVRGDHTHSHGNRGGGPLHALATTTVAGFQSPGDKTLLNNGPGQSASGTCQTNDGATATTVCDTGPLVNGNVYQMQIRIAGLLSTGAAGAGYELAATFRVSGGTVTQVGTTTTVASNTDAATAFSLVISTTHVLVKVNGIAAQIWNWRCSVSMVVAP